MKNITIWKDNQIFAYADQVQTESFRVTDTELVQFDQYNSILKCSIPCKPYIDIVAGYFYVQPEPIVKLVHNIDWNEVLTQATRLSLGDIRVEWNTKPKPISLGTFKNVNVFISAVSWEHTENSISYLHLRGDYDKREP
jgi:hypothetical protein